MLIRYEDYPEGRFTHIGRCGDDGEQFMAFVTRAYPGTIPLEFHLRGVRSDWREGVRWYAVLHRFDARGDHLKTEAYHGEPEDDEEAAFQSAAKKFREMIAALGSYEFRDIEVHPFEVVIDGCFFGLIDEIAYYGDSDDENDSPEFPFRILRPNGILFYPPWNSGRYD